MLRSAASSPQTFDDSCIRAIYRNGARRDPPDETGYQAPFVPLVTRSEHLEGVHISYNLKDRGKRAEQFCNVLYEAMKGPATHIKDLNEAYSTFVDFHCEVIITEDVVVHRTSKLLSQLPAVPAAPIGARSVAWSTFDEGFMYDGTESSEIRTACFENLLVCHYFNINVIRLAIQVVLSREEKASFLAGQFLGFVNTVSEMLEALDKILESIKSENEKKRWLIIKMFLWTSWQRSAMLHLSCILHTQLSWGYDASRNWLLDLKAYGEVAGHVQEARSNVGPHRVESAYMCSWAWNFIRTDRASVVKDFRRFHARYSRVFGSRVARCNQGSDKACNGKGPENCQRFKGMVIRDQSAHDCSCDGICEPLVWDEGSYRAIDGARAVNITRTDNNRLQYCAASKRTLAISHVWSHGQGGRPEVGFNSCLHRRYVAIAKTYGCDSYWMDTPCIPEDHALRDEAIREINNVFRNSLLTLVCDRDVQDFDANDLTIENQEFLLSLLLVCDWNVRAWTLLEAMRGRHNIHLLCKNNRILPLKTVLRAVHEQGAIEIANLLLTSQHLLPTQPPPITMIEQSDVPKSLHRRKQGLIQPEEAACLLAYRHASRPGDEVVIWSLLYDEEPCYTAEAFWTDQIGQIINTGFLFSSQPRLINVPGFSWAPSRPDTQLLASSSSTSSHSEQYQQEQSYTFDGLDTQPARIQAHGLRADWSTHEIAEQTSRFGRWRARIFTHQQPQYSDQAVALRRVRQSFAQEYRHVALIQPLSGLRRGEDGARAYKGVNGGPLYAVIASNDREQWEWKGIHEWNINLPWPTSTWKELVLV